MACLYSDENFPAPVMEALRQLGHDGVSILERGRAGEGVPDAAVLALATAEDRAVVTLNRRDVIRLHNSNPRHAGVVVGTADPDFPAQARRIHEAVEAAGDLTGLLIRVNRPPT